MPIYKTGKTKNGKTQYRVFINYTDQRGTQRRVTRCVYGSAEAKAMEEELRKQLKEIELPDRMTVRQLFDEYMEAKKAEVRTSTYEKSRRILLGDVVTGEMDNTRLDKLTVPVLQKWKNGIGERSTKITTKNNSIKEFNAMLNYAVKMEYIPKNPLKIVGKFKDAYFETVQDKMQYYTPEQFRAYIQAAYDTRKSLLDYSCYVFFNVAYFTGMRKGEINALKWSDIEGNVIHVRRSLAQKTKGHYEETPPKNKSSYRDLQVPQKLLNVLAGWKSTLEQKAEWNEDMRLCGGIKPISDTNIENHNKLYAETAGLPHIRVHDFRHSHASLLCSEGINIQEVARRLGHADVKMTWNTYAHLYPKVEEQALKVLETV